ncbi:hypothetical protein Hanom_Chr01g00024341 [Helianthus anomalus]
MTSIWGMKINKKIPLLGKWFRTKGEDRFVPVQFPAHFNPVYPPPLPGAVKEYAPHMDIPKLPQPRPPPGRLSFHITLFQGVAEYQQLRVDVDRLTDTAGTMSYVLQWLVEEVKERRQRVGLHLRPYHSPIRRSQQQQDPQQQNQDR